ncbi:polyketide synthase dehydratase domain-containing protein, partial [Streptomyces sp. NPDC018031]|uniref:polyketide synthase dehydratase domain-containing protein n=1 Tax=Streptomyces sp. NPDC018031 TaxID=3365033 RepID=UPI0037B4463D
DAVEALAAEGAGFFLEIGADGTLTALAQECLDDDAAAVTCAATQLKDRPEAQAAVAAVGRLHTGGVPVRWEALTGRARTVELPTYAFRHERYWLSSASGPGDTTALGQRDAGHPLLGATVEPADGGVLLTGRLSLPSHPWLAGHAVAGTVLLPGTAFVELAIRAGDEVGCGRIDELTLQAPLTLPERGGVRIQVAVGEPDPAGGRPVRISSRAEDAADDTPWIRHATGTLTVAGAPAFDLTAWPPPGSEPVDVAGLYPWLETIGSSYRPPFQGLRAAWRHGEVTYAEVELPADTEPDRFGLHPALLDSALHGALLATVDDPGAGLRLPFSWSGAELYATGASAARVRLTPAGDGALTVELADTTGAPLAAVETLATRPVSADQVRGAHDDGLRDSLFRVEWLPAPAESHPTDPGRVVTITGAVAGRHALAELARLADDADGAPDLVVWQVPPSEDVRASVTGALELLRGWLADDRFGAGRLAFVTRHGLLAHAAVAGLVRSAQSENPDRLLLVETDPAETGAGAPAHGEAERDTAPAALPDAALSGAEPHVRLRDGEVLVPRLARAESAGLLTPPGEGPWHLDFTAAGTLENLALVPRPEVAEPLAPGQVRIAVRAAGMNFRDALIALGMYPGEATPFLGDEAAGVVLAVGEGVTGLAPGDRVLGLVPRAFGPQAVTDQRLLARVPEGWSFERAASVPVVFLTAW